MCNILKNNTSTNRPTSGHGPRPVMPAAGSPRSTREVAPVTATRSRKSALSATGPSGPAQAQVGPSRVPSRPIPVAVAALGCPRSTATVKQHRPKPTKVAPSELEKYYGENYTGAKTRTAHVSKRSSTSVAPPPADSKRPKLVASGTVANRPTAVAGPAAMGRPRLDAIVLKKTADDGEWSIGNGGDDALYQYN